MGAFQEWEDGDLFSEGTSPLLKMRFLANLDATGTANFQIDPANASPSSDILTIEPSEPVLLDRIEFGGLSIQILGDAPPEMESPLDINADGSITALDALLVINDLNEHGAHAIGGGAEGEAIAYSRLDVNGDSYVSAIDALAVINYLNHGVTLEDAVEAAEGEAMAVLDVALADEGCLMMPTAADKAVETVSSATIESNTDNSQYQAAEQLALALWASNEVDSSDNPSEADALEDAIDEVASEISDFWNEA